MKKTALFIVGISAIFCMGFAAKSSLEQANKDSEASTFFRQNPKASSLKLGVFSMSLSVKDLAVSKAFYENLGFTAFGGGIEQNYLIMKNGNALIGLFQGMFEGNILTFNPGWDENAENVEGFDDIRVIQKQLKESGIALLSEADEKSSGPASLMLTDPDGNLILLDQHR